MVSHFLVHELVRTSDQNEFEFVYRELLVAQNWLSIVGWGETATYIVAVHGALVVAQKDGDFDRIVRNQVDLGGEQGPYVIHPSVVTSTAWSAISEALAARRADVSLKWLEGDRIHEQRYLWPAGTIVVEVRRTQSTGTHAAAPERDADRKGRQGGGGPVTADDRAAVERLAPPATGGHR